MKRISTYFLQVVISLIGFAALAFLLIVPRHEGVNINKTNFQIYFQDPFLAYAYIASIPFFVILYQACKVLSSVRQNKIFTESSVKAFRIMKYSAMSMIAFVIGGEIWIMNMVSDDRAGAVAMGILITFVSIVIAAAAAMFERVLQNAVELKSENDLTV